MHAHRITKTGARRQAIHRALLVIIAAALSLCFFSSPASAFIRLYREPASLNTTTNTWWIYWEDTARVGRNYVCAQLRRNGVPVGEKLCSDILRLPMSGGTWWFRFTELDPGAAYDVDFTLYVDHGNGVFIPSGPSNPYDSA